MANEVPLDGSSSLSRRSMKSWARSGIVPDLLRLDLSRGAPRLYVPLLSSPDDAAAASWVRSREPERLEMGERRRKVDESCSRRKRVRRFELATARCDSKLWREAGGRGEVAVAVVKGEKEASEAGRGGRVGAESWGGVDPEEGVTSSNVRLKDGVGGISQARSKGLAGADASDISSSMTEYRDRKGRRMGSWEENGLGPDGRAVKALLGDEFWWCVGPLSRKTHISSRTPNAHASREKVETSVLLLLMRTDGERGDCGGQAARERVEIGSGVARGRGRGHVDVLQEEESGLGVVADVLSGTLLHPVLVLVLVGCAGFRLRARGRGAGALSSVGTEAAARERRRGGEANRIEAGRLGVGGVRLLNAHGDRGGRHPGGEWRKTIAPTNGDDNERRQEVRVTCRLSGNWEGESWVKRSRSGEELDGHNLRS